MTPEQLQHCAREALTEIKANNIVVLDVRGQSSVTDFMLIASGTSDRHVKACANRVLEAAREQGVKPIGMEGEQEARWVLIDLGDVVVHVMHPDTREFYQLERLWDMGAKPEAGEDVAASAAQSD